MTTTTLRTSLLAVCLGAALLSSGCTDAGDPTIPEPPTGEWRTATVNSSQYLNNRFFRLDLPPDWHGVPGSTLGYPHADTPGRTTDDRIVRDSIRIYRSLGSIQPGVSDLQYVAAGIDSSGIWDPDYVAALTSDVGNWTHAWVWRQLNVTFLQTVQGDLVAVDLGQEMGDDDILAVTYDVRRADDTTYEVGDQPEDGDVGGLLIDGQPYYRMKLLKPAGRDYFTFQYVLRNIYSLGVTYVDPSRFEMTLETTLPVDQPDQHDNTGYTYLEVFGLDVEDEQGALGSDGVPDWHRWATFDLANGLLRFPLDTPFPFAAPEDFYRLNGNLADGGNANRPWAWDGTLLQESLAPELYAWTTSPTSLPVHARFRFVVRYWQWYSEAPGDPGDVTLRRRDWSPASVPVGTAHAPPRGSTTSAGSSPPSAPSDASSIPTCPPTWETTPSRPRGYLRDDRHGTGAGS